MIANKAEKSVYLLNSYAPVLHLHSQANLFDLLSELLVEVRLRHLMLAALQGALALLRAARRLRF